MDNIFLISGWNEQSLPVFKKLPLISNELNSKKQITMKLLAIYTQTKSTPPCGNLHAGTGNIRVLTNGTEISFNSEKELQQIYDNYLTNLGYKILISAGHYMPFKHDTKLVNINSLKSFLYGVEMLRTLIKRGIEADLLITLNDVTVNSIDANRNDLPTLSSDERKHFYDNFCLPEAYLSEISKLINEFGNVFKVYIVGENKLSERLSKEAGKLTDLGLLSHSEDQNSYFLNFDVKKIVELAHNHQTQMNELYDSNVPILISNKPGISGRPKCVRACAKLAALPYEMNYSGFIQYLPVCSRNALEGFLIGKEIYKQKHGGKEIPYISVHNVFSCF